MPHCFIGVDPGASGGFAVLSPGGVSLLSMPENDDGIWKAVSSIADWCRESSVSPVAAIENIKPRPGYVVPCKEARVMLPSGAKLYGNYRALRMALVAAGISVCDVEPQAWQSWLGIKKKRGEKSTPWKNRLKDMAKGLFPQEKVTLAVADALLLAWYVQSMTNATRIATSGKKR